VSLTVFKYASEPFSFLKGIIQFNAYNSTVHTIVRSKYCIYNYKSCNSKYCNTIVSCVHTIVSSLQTIVRTVHTIESSLQSIVSTVHTLVSIVLTIVISMQTIVNLKT